MGSKPHPDRLALAIGVALGLVAAAALAFGETAAQPGSLALAAVLALGLVPLLTNAFDERPDVYVIGRSVAVAAALAIAYFVLQRASAAVFSGVVTNAPALGLVGWLALTALVTAFVGLTVLQALLPKLAPTPLWQALYAHTANGFYINTYVNRLILKGWPAGSPKTALGG
jgi:NAD(P)H-quinone oxidoreductase subunit 5